MNRITLVALLAVFGASASSGTEQDAFAPGADRTDGATTPVVVELFTSEGCSSCPPADAVLRRLRREQPVGGTRIIALGEHVDYWNYLGWTDRFSSAALSARQTRYQERVFPRGVVYTPQVVVDGVDEAVGSDPAAVRRAIERAAHRDKLDVRIRAVRAGAGAGNVRVSVAVNGAVRGPADVVLVAVEDDLHTAVGRGENRGRTLSHDAVVRAMDTIGHVDPHDAAPSFERSLPLREGWNAEQMRVIALVQDAASLAILGATEVPLAAH
jgi:hypothetical protein